jgi:hypothetical protein
MNANNQPEENFNNNTNINPNNINNIPGGNNAMGNNAIGNNAMVNNMEEDEKKIYTNADLVRLLKLSKLVNNSKCCHEPQLKFSFHLTMTFVNLKKHVVITNRK